MKKILLIILCIVHCTLCIKVMSQEKNMIDGVVWVVGDEAILRSDVEQERIRAQYEGQPYRATLIVSYQNRLQFKNYLFTKPKSIVLR